MEETIHSHLLSMCRFLTAERELAKNVELPLVNGLGFSKKHFRCLQVFKSVHFKPKPLFLQTSLYLSLNRFTISFCSGINR